MKYRVGLETGIAEKKTNIDAIVEKNPKLIQEVNLMFETWINILLLSDY